MPIQIKPPAIIISPADKPSVKIKTIPAIIERPLKRSDRSTAYSEITTAHNDTYRLRITAKNEIKRENHIGEPMASSVISHHERFLF